MFVMSFVLRETAAFGSIVLFASSCLMWGDALTQMLP
ncbi:hypothetical protein PSE_3414 [Pseudovibrio sp. FO-BEG1]|nr:hypothetical protein PSE_3414 [Pseudovibrio sp. FO-BEG1]